ncbi:MAG: GH3 family domain-containing protein, partial [Saprospiraceae bacterium]
MGFRSAIIRPVAHWIARDIDRWSANAVHSQQRVLDQLLEHGSRTAFGRDHRLSEVRSYNDFKQAVPIRDYEGLKHYIE